MKLEKENLLEMYRKMVRIRKFEVKVEELHIQGILPGLKHLYIGEEAVAVGVISNLREDDYIASTHRGHGHCIAKGGDIKKMMAELYGKRTGYSPNKACLRELFYGFFSSTGSNRFCPGHGLCADCNRLCNYP